LASLQHRTIVSVYDVFDDDGVWLVGQCGVHRRYGGLGTQPEKLFAAGGIVAAVIVAVAVLLLRPEAPMPTAAAGQIGA
jgi:hypothetical protein